MSVIAGRTKSFSWPYRRDLRVDARDRRQHVEDGRREEQDEDDADHELGQRGEREVADVRRSCRSVESRQTALSEPMRIEKRDADERREEDQHGGVEDAVLEQRSSPAALRTSDVPRLPVATPPSQPKYCA